LIPEGEAWIDMLEDRNLTAHTYDEAQARKIYHRIKIKHYKILKELKDTLGREIKS